MEPIQLTILRWNIGCIKDQIMGKYQRTANAVSSMTAVNFSEMKISSNPVETLVAFSIGAGIGMIGSRSGGWSRWDFKFHSAGFHQGQWQQSLKNPLYVCRYRHSCLVEIII